MPQYTERRFRRAFRVPRSVFDILHKTLSERLTTEQVAGRPAI